MWLQVKAMLRLRAGVRSDTAAPQAPGVGTYLLQLQEAEYHIENAIDDLLARPPEGPQSKGPLACLLRAFAACSPRCC